MGSCLIIVEDGGYRNLLPLAYVRPVYDLRCGVITLRERIQRVYGVLAPRLHCRSYLGDLLAMQNEGLNVNSVCNEPCLIINGRVLADEQLATKVPMDGQETLYTNSDGEFVAARVSAEKASKLFAEKPEVVGKGNFDGLPCQSVDVVLTAQNP